MNASVQYGVIESLLRERMGFGVYSTGTLAGCINRRMQANGMDNEALYVSFLLSNDLEQEELVEELIVPETWFFRDYEPFAHLKNFVAEKAHAFTPRTPLRALSLPASTGEEPYSIAITLMEAGLTPDRFSVHAVDISRRALRKSLDGLYGGPSFREDDLDLRRKYFDKAGSMLLVRPEVRDTVQFTRGNILKDFAPGSQESFDVVFFRNLLIYLDEKSRAIAVRNVERILKKGGLLVLGYAEPQHLFFPDFTPVAHPRSYSSLKPLDTGVKKNERCCFAKFEAPTRGFAAGGKKLFNDLHAMSQPCSEDGHHRQMPSPSMGEAGGQQKLIDTPDEPPPLKAEATTPRNSAAAGKNMKNSPAAFIKGRDALNAMAANPAGAIERARELADAGMLASAEELAGNCLKSDAGCIEAHYLLAMTALARGEEENAATHLNRVIYLDPNHNDALLHLSLLMDRLGRTDQAARYRTRIARAGKEP